MSSNTAENSGAFKKGDPRINRKGRPKNFDALRRLAMMIGNETLTAKDGTAMSRAEAILRGWSFSNNYQLQKAFIEIAYGKVPDNIEVKTSGKVKIQLKWLDSPEDDK